MNASVPQHTTDATTAGATATCTRPPRPPFFKRTTDVTKRTPTVAASSAKGSSTYSTSREVSTSGSVRRAI